MPAACLGLGLLLVAALDYGVGPWLPSGPSGALVGTGGAHTGGVHDDAVRGPRGGGWRGPPAHGLPGGPESAQNGDAGPHCDGPAGVRGPRRPAFLEGVEIAGTHYQAPEAEHPVVQAIMHHMWAEARKQWATHIEVPAPAAVPVPSAAPPGAVVPALPGDRPPKTFPEWGPLVKRYNEVTVAGEPRDFPTNLLLGAEEVLARMYFEHTKSKEYTAVGLGEILQRRTFTAAMEVNPLAVRRHKEKGQAIRIVDGALVHDREDPWNPRGILGVIDGIEAVRWAWTLTGVATEKGAAEYAQWWTSRARQRPSQLEAITEYWDAASRRLAMQMRLRRTFEEVTAEIMKDQAAFLDILSGRPPARQKISEGYNPPDPETDGQPGSTWPRAAPR